MARRMGLVAAVVAGAILGANALAPRLPAEWAPHAAFHLSWALAAGALAAAVAQVRVRSRPSAARATRVGSALVVAGFAWVTLAQTAEALAAWLEHPHMGPLHTAASVAVLAAVPGVLLGGNAWAWGVTPPRSPLRWGIVGGLLLLAGMTILLLAGADG